MTTAPLPSMLAKKPGVEVAVHAGSSARLSVMPRRLRSDGVVAAEVGAEDVGARLDDRADRGGGFVFDAAPSSVAQAASMRYDFGVAYLVTTALGREVPIENWREIHRDTILKVLYDLRMINRSAVLTVGALSGATGLSTEETRRLCVEIESAGHIEKDGVTYSLTSFGETFVRDTHFRLRLAGGMG